MLSKVSSTIFKVFATTQPGIEPSKPMSRYKKQLTIKIINQGALGVMVIFVGNGHGDSSSNPG